MKWRKRGSQTEKQQAHVGRSSSLRNHGVEGMGYLRRVREKGKEMKILG